MLARSDFDQHWSLDRLIQQLKADLAECSIPGQFDQLLVLDQLIGLAESATGLTALERSKTVR